MGNLIGGLSEEEILMVSCIAGGMTKKDAYLQCIAPGMDDKQATKEANKLCRTSRFKTALGNVKGAGESGNGWEKDFGADFLMLDSIIQKSMLPATRVIFDPEGNIYKEEIYYPGSGSAIMAINLKVKVKMAYKAPDGRVKRLAKIVQMKEKGFLTEEDLRKAIEAELA